MDDTFKHTDPVEARVNDTAPDGGAGNPQVEETPRHVVSDDWANISYSLSPALERPQFALGDDERAFETIYEDLFRRFQPDAWGRTLVYEAAVATQEIMRLRRWRMQIIRFMAPQTLDEVLKTLVTDEERRRLLAGWRAGNNATIEEVEDIMSHGGRSLEMIEALSFFKEIEKFKIIDQMIAEQKKTRDNAFFTLERQAATQRRDEHRFEHVLRHDQAKGLLPALDRR